MKVRFPLAASLFLCLSIATVNAGASSQSLKGKSDEELLRIVAKGRNDTQKQQSMDFPFSIDSSLLDRLWEMPPREAALALASEYVEKEAKGHAKFVIESDPSEKPPTSGEIGIRWISGNYYAMPEHGATVLHYENPRSQLSISDFQILGRVSNQEIESALNRTDDYQIPAPVAQQAYEILWWLNHVHPVGDRAGGSSFSSVDDLCDAFWMNPGGPYFGRTLLGVPNAEDLDNKEFSPFPAFAETLLRQIVEKQSIKRKDPLPSIGHFVDINADAAFLRLHPTPERSDPGSIKSWISQMLTILQKPERHKMYGDVLYDLVPTSAPLKYKDTDIDRGLLDLFHRGEAQAAAHERAQRDADSKRQVILDQIAQGKAAIHDPKERSLSNQSIEEGSAASSIRSDAEIAADMLGQRDQVEVFPELMKHAERFRPGDCGFDGANALIGAAELAGRHPELRPQLRSFLRAQLAAISIRIPQFSPRQVFDCVWRANDRELFADLEKVATQSSDENEDSSMYSSPVPPNGNGKFHAARAILTAWRETDRLTKAKLDALVTGYVGWGGPVPDFLRSDVNALPADEKQSFLNFIAWLRKVDAPFSKEALEDVFTPHTPRPKEDDLGLRRFLYE